MYMAATTRTALLTKLNNRKSKRDIEREIRIEFKTEYRLISPMVNHSVMMRGLIE